MKKLLFCPLFLLLISSQLASQEKSISLVLGPNDLLSPKDFSDEVLGGESHFPMGYLIGLDFAKKLGSQWQFKLAVRYNVWQMPQLQSGLQWPSEHDGNGGYLYDPSLPHHLQAGFAKQSALQLLPGIRWQSKPQKLHWFAGAEVGLSSFFKKTAGITTRLRPTAGLNFGLELAVGPNLNLFIQPGSRYVFQSIKKDGAFEYGFWVFQLETGVRWSF